MPKPRTGSKVTTPSASSLGPGVKSKRMQAARWLEKFQPTGYRQNETTMPHPAQTPARKPPTSRRNRQAKTIRVGLVAERPLLRSGLRAVLAARDLRVAGEAEFRSACRLVRSTPLDVLVIDAGSDEAQALALVRRIKEVRSRLSVLLLSASEDEEVAGPALAVQRGCSGYLGPQATAGDLRRAIRAVARGECTLDPREPRQLLLRLAQTPPARPVPQLTVPQREVLRLIAEGLTNQAIAQRLGYSLGTVKDYTQAIIRKLGVSDRTQAAVKGVRLGLV